MRQQKQQKAVTKATIRGKEGDKIIIQKLNQEGLKAVIIIESKTTVLTFDTSSITLVLNFLFTYIRVSHRTSSKINFLLSRIVSKQVTEI